MKLRQLFLHFSLWTSFFPLVESYRPIALASTLSKALEWCIFLVYERCLSTSDLQFGFKPGFSTSMCTGMVKNVVSRYLHHGSAVFASFFGCLKGL